MKTFLQSCKGIFEEKWGKLIIWKLNSSRLSKTVNWMGVVISKYTMRINAENGSKSEEKILEKHNWANVLLWTYIFPEFREKKC